MNIVYSVNWDIIDCKDEATQSPLTCAKGCIGFGWTRTFQCTSEVTRMQIHWSPGIALKALLSKPFVVMEDMGIIIVCPRYL